MIKELIDFCLRDLLNKASCLSYVHTESKSDRKRHKKEKTNNTKIYSCVTTAVRQKGKTESCTGMPSLFFVFSEWKKLDISALYLHRKTL